MQADNQSNGLYINRSLTDSDNNYYNRVTSSITLMEICSKYLKKCNGISR